MITPPLPHGLIAGAQRRLSPSNDLASPTLLDGLHGKTFAHFAGLVRAEAAREAERPSFENLPESVYDPGAKLERQDSATGQRFVEFRAQRSFIADMKPPTIRAIIADPRTLSGRQMISRDVLLTKHPVRV